MVAAARSVPMITMLRLPGAKPAPVPRPQPVEDGWLQCARDEARRIDLCFMNGATLRDGVVTEVNKYSFTLISDGQEYHVMKC